MKPIPHLKKKNPCILLSISHFSNQHRHINNNNKEINFIEYHNMPTKKKFLFFSKIFKKNKKNSYTGLGNFPPSQEPRNRRGKSDGDRNSNREQSFVTKHSECQSSTSRSSELSRPIQLLLFNHHRRLILWPICLFHHKPIWRRRGRRRGLGLWVWLWRWLWRRWVYVKVLEEGLDVEVVLDGDVEAGDRGGGDGEVDT